MKRILGAALSIAVVAAACGPGASSPSPASTATPSRPAPSATSAASPSKATPLGKVRFALDWTPNTNHTGIYVAEANGWYDQAGVDLQILPYASTTPEALIAAGRVEVDGQVVTELGVRIDPARQVVHVDGVRVNLDESRVYLAFNKPVGVVSTMNDELGRISLADYVGNRNERLFHVGRLDADTEGLLLLTNDGDLANRLQHPSFGVAKTYIARIPGPVPRDLGRRLRDGVELDDGPANVDSFKVVDSQPGKALIEVVLHEGRKHIVRRMLDAVGHPVETLVRVQVGPIRLGDLKSGRTRRLTPDEVGQLYASAGM